MKTKSLRTKMLIVTLLGGFLFASMVLAHGTAEPQPQDGGALHLQHSVAKSQHQGGNFAEVRLFDLELVTQDGEPLKFASGAVGDNLVVIAALYSGCTTVCPVTSVIFAQLQRKLGGRLNQDIRLISISVDPARDTPDRLKAYSRKHHAGPGWLWLTGDKSRVDRVLTGLGAYSANFEDHPSGVLVGDARSGKWSRFFGFTGPNQIMTRLDELTAARQTAALNIHTAKEN